MRQPPRVPVRRVDLMQYGAAAVPALDISHRGILYLDNVTVSFDGFKALDGLSFYVDDGDCAA